MAGKSITFWATACPCGADAGGSVAWQLTGESRAREVKRTTEARIIQPCFNPLELSRVGPVKNGTGRGERKVSTHGTDDANSQLFRLLCKISSDI
jgi:hypothetical protein